MDHSRYSNRRCSQANKVAKSKSKRCDHLSELPDSLILSILSLLQMRDVVRTTVLSKFWRNRWTKVPCLHFLYDQNHSSDLLKYRDFINCALKQWDGPKILKFAITFYESYPDANYFDPWLLLAIEKQVEELSFVIKYRTGDRYYSPPQRLYSCSSLTKLSLSYFKLVIEENVQWDRLKSLRLANVNSLSADAMNRILCGAPCLEELLIFCIERITESFSIRSTSLKTLYFSRERVSYFPEIIDVCADSELRIWAPNLLTLEIHARFDCSCFLYGPSLTKAVLYFVEPRNEFGSRIEMFNHVFQSVRHVENITLSPCCCKFLVHMKKDMALQFSNAKFLNMYRHIRDGLAYQHEMLDIEMFPNLMNLTVKYDYGTQKGYVLTTKMTPSRCHLKTIEIFVCVNYSSIFDWIKVLVKNAHSLEKMLLRLSMLYGVHEETKLKTIRRMFDSAEKKMRTMLRSSSKVEVTVIRQV